MLITPNWPAMLGLASTSSLATLTRPPYSLARSSTIGASILQGLHQSAQKSTKTGVSALITSLSKVSSLTWTGSAMLFSWRQAPPPAGAALSDAESLFLGVFALLGVPTPSALPSVEVWGIASLVSVAAGLIELVAFDLESVL